MGCFGDEKEEKCNKVGVEESENSGKFGAPKSFDPNFRGPIKNRSCTDVICCILFVIFILGQLLVTYFAYRLGDPSLLLSPTDSDGKSCGRGEKANKPLLFYFDLSECARLGPQMILSRGCPTPTVCVSSCPSTNWVFTTVAAREAVNGKRDINERAKMICKDGINASHQPYLGKDIDELILDKECAPYRLESTPLIKRCVPKILFKAVESASRLVSVSGEVVVNGNNMTINGQILRQGTVVFKVAEFAQKVLNDVVTCWWLLLIGFVLSLLTSFIWIVLLRFLAGCMVWCTLILFLIVFFGGACYCFYRYYFIATKSFHSEDFEFQLNGEIATYFTDYKESWLAFGIVAAVIGLIILLIIICLRKRLQLAIALMGQASKAVASIPCSLVYPIFPFIFQVLAISYGVATSIYLASVAKPTFSRETGNSSNSSFELCGEDVTNAKHMHCHFYRYAGENWSVYLLLYTLFVSLWVLNFVIAFGQITLAGSFASWYWAWEKPKDVPTFPILSSFGRASRYHMGSLAFGALIIAIIQMIRIILEYVDRKLKRAENPIAKFVICCLKCFFWCLEKFMKFINKNAYIMIAIYGENFCKSARDAFFLLMRNIVRVVVVDRVTTFVLLVGQLMVVGNMTALAFFFFNGQIPNLRIYVPSLNYFYVPVCLIAVGTFFIARLFFSVFDFAVDTLFLCAMEDLERHDGSPEKPFFMGKELMKLLDKENKFDDSSKKEGCGLCCC